MSALDIREQQADPAGSGASATVTPESSTEDGARATNEAGAAVNGAGTMSTDGAEAGSDAAAPAVGASATADAGERPTFRPRMAPAAAAGDAQTTGDTGTATADAASATDADQPAAGGDTTSQPATEASAEASADGATEPAAPAVPEFDFDSNELGDVASLMEAFLANPEHDYKSLKYGDVMDGIIMHVDRDELLVDIGSKAEGIIPAKEYSDMTAAEKNALEVGDTILVFVVQPENPEGHPIVSINRARQEKSWRRLQEQHEANEVIEAEVTNYNKGGLLVNLDGVRGFVPASQVTEIRGGDDASKQADMARLIGNNLPLKIIEINRHRNRLILSERQAIQERRDVMKEKLIAELHEGEVRKGRVSSICDFGAFVDIGGADGLVHLSELSWSRVRHPSELLKVGEEVDVFVLGINAQDKKIALSIKRTQPEPWSRVATKYEVGQLVRGTVTQLANFGAFARIEDGIEGLVHVSELADERITHPKQAVHEGQELLLRIIRIDPQRRRMGLSLRRALDTPDQELIQAFGDDALAERDRIIEEIRSSLAAEGIEYQPTRSDAGADAGMVPAAAPVSGAYGENAAAENIVAPIDKALNEPLAEDMVTARTIADFQMPTERPQPKRRQERDRRPERAAAPVEAEGELSAMAMAFAMAGANLDEEAAQTNAASTDTSSADTSSDTAASETNDAPASSEAASSSEPPASDEAGSESESTDSDKS